MFFCKILGFVLVLRKVLVMIVLIVFLIFMVNVICVFVMDVV